MKKLLHIPLYLWSLPNTLIGLILCALWYHPYTMRWENGALHVVSRRTLLGGKWVWGQTFGCVIVYRDAVAEMSKDLREHEMVHVRQGLYGGVFFLIAYAVVFLYQFSKLRNFDAAYRANYFEKKAYDRD